MIDPEKLLEESDRYNRYLAGGDTKLTPDELARQDRYHHALDLITRYSFSNKNARKIHAEKFDVSLGTVETDFMIAYQLLGKRGVFNRESNKNWALYKIMKAIDAAVMKDDLKALHKFLSLWYKFSEIDKQVVDLPNLSDFKLKEIRVELHPEVIQNKLNPQLLEEKIRKFYVPKGSKVIEEAKIVKDGGAEGKI